MVAYQSSISGVETDYRSKTELQLFSLDNTDERRLTFETEAIGINTSEYSELLSAGGNKPAKSENFEPYATVEELSFVHPNIREETRIALSRASCQVGLIKMRHFFLSSNFCPQS